MDPRAALEQFIRFVTHDTVYHAQYPSTVQGQHDDDSLDLLPDDERVRGTGLSRVAIRHGLPGVRVRVLVGSRVLLGFEAGDPRRPYAALWEPGAIEAIMFDGGDKPIARLGDSVTCFWPPSVAVTGTLNLLPFAGTLTIVTPGIGLIESGAKRVTA